MKKYRILLVCLRILMYCKRALWWGGRFFGRVGAIIFWPVFKGGLFVRYKLSYWLKKSGAGGLSGVVWGRNLMQLALFGVLFLVALPQTKFLGKTDPALAGRSTIAFSLLQSDSNFEIQEINVNENVVPVLPTIRQTGAISYQPTLDYNNGTDSDSDLGGVVAGGGAILKPTILSGAVSVAPASVRQSTVTYEVKTGDSLNLIAQRFGIKLATILWENNLTERSLIRPGVILKIPPVDGVLHTVKKGDTLQKIANLYGAKTADIIAFNNLNIKGTNLIIGDRIMVPGGTKKVASGAKAPAGRTSASAITRAAPPRSLSGPSASGFIWPSGIHTITQYYNWSHHALDIAGPWQTPNYAAKAGTVEKAQCGWNNGYGCMIIIDHGGGVKTLYGHNSVLLVSPGDYVEAGQTIGLMGNTGKVRGRTGIHLHFEIIINGGRVNPLGYVR